MAGGLVFTAAAVLVMGMMTAEALLPGYHVGEDTISHLAAAEPSATVFNATIIVSGVLFVAGSLLFNRCELRWWIAAPTLLMGAGAVGVGLFPYHTGAPHALFALLTFASGGAAAILSSRMVAGPFRWISLCLGGIALFALVLFAYMWGSEPFGPLGEGGMERWVAYPVVLWGLGFGGYLMGSAGRPGMTDGGPCER